MILQIKNISKKFADKQVLNNISFNAHKNEVIALIGPSGGGKSTILKCINFLEKIDSGEIIYNGITLTKNNIKQYIPKIGMVFQNFNLFPHMTVLENLTFAPKKVLNISEEEATKTAIQLLNKVGLAERADQYPSSLSGGQKQRIAIARSLCMNPDILLLDEPTSALDPEVVQDVLDMIKGFVHSGITIIMATHEMNFAKNFADKIIFIDNGAVVEESDPKELFDSPKSGRVKEFLEKVL